MWSVQEITIQGFLVNFFYVIKLCIIIDNFEIVIIDCVTKTVYYYYFIESFVMV